MKLGVISDTHGHAALTRPAIRMLESLDVDRVLHCGDIGSPEVVELFAKWPTHFVYGNCDSNRAELAAAVEAAGQSWHGAYGELELDGRRIALLHSDDRRLFRDTVQGGQFDLVCYGHTHVAAIDQQGPTLVLNPGAIYRAEPHSLAVVELPGLQATIVQI
jgi:putative phosphoesterase